MRHVFLEEGPLHGKVCRTADEATGGRLERSLHDEYTDEQWVIAVYEASGAQREVECEDGKIRTAEVYAFAGRRYVNKKVTTTTERQLTLG